MKGLGLFFFRPPLVPTSNFLSLVIRFRVQGLRQVQFLIGEDRGRGLFNRVKRPLQLLVSGLCVFRIFFNERFLYLRGFYVPLGVRGEKLGIVECVISR